ncbi:MAG TPA: FAD:protein FMN transferase [Microbacteriaceae bacterium]|nr:FAD:protein FMN transferase [Microbacteriaceae bacterium]
MRFEGIGVPWEIETAMPLDAAVQNAILERVEAYDRAWSRFRTDSLVARIGREPGEWRLPAEAGALLALYRELYEATDGRMSPLVGASLDRLGYGAGLSLRPSGDPLPAIGWEDAIAWDGSVLSAPRPVSIDVGAAGKGQLCDLVGDVLREHGIEEFVVDASGDILRRGGGTIRVALEHPADPSLAVGLVELGDGAICASATNRRSWGDGVHHILDALTGFPVDDIVATWAIAADAMTADGVATALFLTPGERIPSALGAEWAKISASGRIEVSDGFPGEVFT